jgi:RHS repeat-associated protein
VARYTQTQNVDEPLAMERGSTVDYYEADGLGSITSLTASNGTVAQSYTYDSFGNTTNSSGSLTNFFRYTGREFDTETNLYYYRARYYDQTTGRFIGEDPIGFGSGSDFYSYVRNNAALLIDPSGQLQVCCRPANIGNIMIWLPKSKKPCHCFLKLSDGETIGGYNTFGILHSGLKNGDDRNPITIPTCTNVPGDECKVRKTFEDYVPFGLYGLSGTSNTVSAQILSDAGISFGFPSCAWGADLPNLPPNFTPYGPFGPLTSSR